MTNDEKADTFSKVSDIRGLKDHLISPKEKSPLHHPQHIVTWIPLEDLHL